MIRVLSENLVNKIAAGEVIVRPASVIKELVENSLDAGSTRIYVEVGNGCRDLKVRDDGCGMDREDCTLALVRHATSKITDFDDLYALSTRGFRGEALASIAAVSRLQILTRKRDNVAGTRIVAEGAGDPRIEPAGAPEGTEIRVRDLFFNTPARLKFMKSAGSELQQVMAMVTRQALIRPDIGFTVANEKSTLIDLPPSQPWGERVSMLLGSGIAEHLLEVEGERHGVRVRGFVLRPAASRKDRRHQFFFVNGRPVTSRSLSFVLQEAYKGIIMVQRFPIAVLDIIVPDGDVDVNVHPTKEEVRFRNEAMVNGVVHRVVHDRLQSANLLPEIRFDEGEAYQGPIAGPGGEGQQGFQLAHPGNLQGELLGNVPHGSGFQPTPTIPVDFSMFTNPGHSISPSRDESLAVQASQVAVANREFEHVLSSEQKIPDHESAKLPSAGTDCTVRPIVHSIRGISEPVEDTTPAGAIFRNGFTPEPLGQVARCYIIAQAGNDLLLIDQHAAHERLQYLRFASARQETPTQPLLIPVSVDIAATAVGYMERLLPLFAQLGLKIEHFGGQTYLVQSIPADLPNLDAAGVISDLLDDFESLGKVEQIEVLRDRIITRMACRSAIKAGQQLHMEEMRALIRDIAHARLGFTCPHGRPTMILLTRDQLDRQFKRKL